MAEIYPWADALNVTPEQLKEWTESLPDGQSLLAWCLQNSKIDENQYLSWASETYQMPLLKREFFKALPTPAHRLRQLVDESQLWSQHFFPVHEWEGVLFVGCNQKVPEFPNSQPLAFVLAPPTELEQLWLRLHSDNTVIRPTPSKPLVKDSEPTEPNVIPFPVQESARPKGATLSIEDLLGSAEPVEPPPAEPASDAPEGLSALSAAPVTPIEMPEGLTLAPTLVMPTPVADIAPAAVETPVVPTAPAQPIQTDLVESARGDVFAKLVPPFEKAMLLTFTNGELTVAKWTPGWHPNAQSKTAISLSEPSIFKIVADTLLPYHGFVVGNPINDAFFSTWNDKKIPKHVTLTPVIVNQKLVSVLMGTVSEGSPSMSLLTLMENASSELAQQKIKVA